TSIHFDRSHDPTLPRPHSHSPSPDRVRVRVSPRAQQLKTPHSTPPDPLHSPTSQSSLTTSALLRPAPSSRVLGQHPIQPAQRFAPSAQHPVHAHVAETSPPQRRHHRSHSAHSPPLLCLHS